MLVYWLCINSPIGTAPPLVTNKISVVVTIDTSQLEVDSIKIISELLGNFWALSFKEVTTSITQGLYTL